MKKILLVSVLVCAINLSFAQEEGKKVFYTIKSNDPTKWNLMFDLVPAMVELSPELYFGYELSSEIRVRRLFSLNASYRTPWFKKSSYGEKKYLGIVYSKWHKLAYGADGNYSLLETANEIKPYYFFEAGGGINLSDKIVAKTSDIELKRSKKYRYYSTYTEIETTIETLKGIESKERSIFQVRGGIWTVRTPIWLNGLSNIYENNDKVKITRETKKPITITQELYNTNLGKQENKSVIYFNEDNAFTMMNVSGIYLGFSYISVENLEIEALGYGKKDANLNFSMYVDALYAPLINIEPLKVGRSDKIALMYNDKKYDNVINDISGEYEVDNVKDLKAPEKGGFVNKNFGWRVGLIGRAPGVYGKIEFGSRPAPLKYRGYGMIGLGFSIPFTIKALKPSYN